MTARASTMWTPAAVREAAPAGTNRARHPSASIARARFLVSPRATASNTSRGRTMSLNVKNEETCRLAGELARLTGETMTGAITVALRERLERERHERSVEARVQRLRAIANRCAKLLGPGPSAVEHGDVLYDDRGLPR